MLRNKALNKKIPFISHCLKCVPGPAAHTSPGSSSERKSLRPHPTPGEPESAFLTAAYPGDFYAVKVGEALL